MNATLMPSTISLEKAFANHLASLGHSPDWLLQLKRQSWERFRTLPMPSAKDERWRFASTANLSLEGFFPASLEPAEENNADQNGLPRPSFPVAGTLEFHGDRTVAGTRDQSVGEGVIFLPLAEAISQYPELVRSHLLKRTPDLGSVKFESLHAAFFTNGVFLHVPRDVKVDLPFLVLHHANAREGAALFPHSLIITEAQSQATILEVFQGHGAGRQFVAAAADVTAGPGSRLQYKSIQNWGPQTLAFHLNHTQAERDATMKTIAVNLGSAHLRHEQHTRLIGPGAGVDMFSLSVARGEQEIDQRTLQTHQAPHGRSNLLFKNALFDEAKTIFSGLIAVDPIAQKTDAYQSNRNLLLSGKAEANSLPGLEIRANDVRCTHGATASQLDSNELFYMLSRGIPHDKAAELMVFGFFEEIIDRFENPPLAEYVRLVLQRHLSA